MNILVYAHELDMGGSQINAIEAAAAVRDRGHRVTVTAPEGELVTLIEQLGLDFIPTPVRTYYPSLQTARHLMRLVRQLSLDLIHTYEWRPSMEAAFGPHLILGVPSLMSVMSMDVMSSLPRHIPLFVGTRQLAEGTANKRAVMLMEPPVDTKKHRTKDHAAARRRWGIGDHELVISVVCRLSSEHEKYLGVLEAVDVVADLAQSRPIRLLIVGDGEGRAQIERAAKRVNDIYSSRVVIVTGSLLDARDGYEAADIMLGMGSSALKAMAYSKPLIVQGTRGFWKLADNDTKALFLHQGWFGHCGGGKRDLRNNLDPLLDDVGLRAELGRLGRRIVEEGYSLDQAAERLIDAYAQTIASPAPFREWLPSLGKSAIEELKFRVVMSFGALERRRTRIPA